MASQVCICKTTFGEIFGNVFKQYCCLSLLSYCDTAAALVEALMGFQFNHVGGGTKTRRPITLHMKYNAACVQPNCFLITEDYGEQEVTLEELQVCCC